MINKEPFQKIINNLKSDGKYRVFNDILRERGEFPKAIWYSEYAIKNIINWCSNDYLGMGQNKIVLDDRFHGCNRFLQKIVQIGAILLFFWSLEILCATHILPAFLECVA